MARHLTRRSGRRRAAWVSVVMAVTLVHGWLVRELAQGRVGWGAGHRAMPARIEVAFVRELAPAAPPPVVKRSPPVRRKAVPPPAPAASAADEIAPAPVDPPPPAAEPPQPAAEPPSELALAPDPPADAASEPPAPAAEPASAPASAAAAAFEWPPSTRLAYTLVGNYRGELHGSAQVEWVRAGERYQVHLDVHAALVFSRRMTSDGELTDDGLRPRRYDEETKVLLQEPRRLTMWFGAERVRLANGREVERWPGVQDTASQFVQLTWLFTTQPQLLQPGRSIDLPLALPRRVKWVTLDVVGEDRIETPVGLLDTFHVKPRIDPRPDADLTAEIWFAPTLQYLPVRIRIHQDAQSYVELTLRTPPLQAKE